MGRYYRTEAKVIVGEFLQKKRLEKKLECKDIAVLIGSERSCVNRHEAGWTAPKLHTLVLYAHYLDFDINELKDLLLDVAEKNKWKS